MEKLIKSYPNVKWIAHRGLASKILENTNESFLAAAKLPFFGIETDIHLTLDQVVIVHHDDNIKRLSNYDYIINKTPHHILETVKLKSKYQIPLFSEYLNICKLYNKYAIIELKAPFDLDQIKHILNQINVINYIDQTIIISFIPNNLIAVRNLYPNLKLQFLSDKLNDEIINLAVLHRFDLSLHHSIVTPAIVKQIHNLNLEISVWTVNSHARAVELLKMGIDYITTDGID